MRLPLLVVALGLALLLLPFSPWPTLVVVLFGLFLLIQSASRRLALWISRNRQNSTTTKVGQGESGSSSSARPRATTSKGSRTSGLRVTGAGVELMLQTAPG